MFFCCLFKLIIFKVTMFYLKHLLVVFLTFFKIDLVHYYIYITVSFYVFPIHTTSIGTIHLVCTQNVPENQHFQPREGEVPGGKKCQFLHIINGRFKRYFVDCVYACFIRYLTIRFISQGKYTAKERREICSGFKFIWKYFLYFLMNAVSNCSVNYGIYFMNDY